MKATVKINSFLGGISPSAYFSQEGQYQGGIAIDPDFPITSSAVRTSGALVPTVYEKFSGSNVTAAVVGIVNDPKDTKTYVALTNGRLISYDNALSNETLIGTVTGSVCNGIFYYNNYVYLTTGTDVSRYGPLNNSPTLTNTVWTGATLGSLTALTNTTYPSIRGEAIPNHWGTIHGDGSAYFLDFKNGQGMVHRINTRKVTDEGDTNGSTVPSAYNVLDLPFGFYPTCISSYGNDLVIGAIQTTDSTVNQGKSALFFWDPTNTDTFYLGPVYIPDPILTALQYVNGTLYIWSGNTVNGMRISRYIGGTTVSDLVFMEEGAPSFAGSVEALGNRITWGGFTTYPESAACVFGYGSKNNNLPTGLHNIIRSTSTGSTGNVTAIKYSQQTSSLTPRLLVAWRDGSGYGIDKLSTTATYDSIYRSQIITIGKKFKITRVRIPFGDAVAANMTLVPTIYLDDASSSSSLTTINNTNYSGRRVVTYKAPGMLSLGGFQNFFIELAFSGTAALPVTFPIEFDIEVFEDEIT